MDMLAVERELEAGDGELESSPAHSPQKLPAAVVDEAAAAPVQDEQATAASEIPTEDEEEELHPPPATAPDAPAAAPETPFHAKPKSNTLKKYYKKLFKNPDKNKHKRQGSASLDGEGSSSGVAGGSVSNGAPGTSVGAMAATPAAAGRPASRSGEEPAPAHAPPARRLSQSQLSQGSQPQHSGSSALHTAPAATSTARGSSPQPWQYTHPGRYESSGGAAGADEAAASPAPTPGPLMSAPLPPPVPLASLSSRFGSGRFELAVAGRYESSILDDRDGAASSVGVGGFYDSGRGGTMTSSTASSMGGTIKGLLGKKKKNKQIELDALRMEMEMLQERCSAAENGLSSASHDVSALRADRDALQQQLRDLAVELTASRSAVTRAEDEVARLRALHSQVKGALQGAYSQNQEMGVRVRELEAQTSSQQASLEEAEERYRSLSDEVDALRHTGLQTKAQLVTAQAQVSELRAARDELTAEVASLQQQLATIQADLEARSARVLELEASRAALEAQAGSMLARLRGLESDRQQLEQRQEENVELSRQLEEGREAAVATSARVTALSCENEELRTALEHATARGEEDRARGAAERDGLAAELRSSADIRETLRARNEELESEVEALREALAKKGSPLRWRRGNNAAPAAAGGPKTPLTGSKGGGMDVSEAGAAAVAAAGGNAAPRALFGEQRQWEQHPVAAARSGSDETGVTALVTASGGGAAAGAECGDGEGEVLSGPPRRSDSPALTKGKARGGGPATVRSSGGSVATISRGSRSGPGGGGRGGVRFLDGLLGCFHGGAVRRPIPTE